MSGANYAHCPFCEKKALYTGDEDLLENVVVVHESCLDAQAANATIEIKREARSWEYFASLAFAYFDAPQDAVEHAWWELGGAIDHWRKTGGRAPRGEDEWRSPVSTLSDSPGGGGS